MNLRNWIPAFAGMTNRKIKSPWFWSVLFFFLCFAFLRFYDISARPFHNDEGVNGFFTNNLIKSGDYKYDPKNYHGPSLYYLQLIPSWIAGFVADPTQFHFSGSSGLTVFSTRATIACASLLYLMGFLACRNFLGKWGALVAFLFAGTSANLLFFSRYFIHETYVVLFTFGVFIGFLKFIESRRRGFLFLAVLSATLLFCTKETGILHLLIMALAAVASFFIEHVLDGRGLRSTRAAFLSMVRRTFSLPLRLWITLLVLAVGVWILLYSSFFTNVHGPLDSFRAYIPWLKEGLESGHRKPWHYFLYSLLAPYETGLLGLTIAGAVVTVIKNEFRGWFLLLWTLGIIGIYSAIPYKTPWCVINLILPMTLLTGYTVQTTISWILKISIPGIRWRSLVVLAILVGGCLTYPWPLMWTLNFQDSSNPRHPQVYVHTSDDIYRLIDDIHSIAKKIGTGDDIHLDVVSPEYWPIPFYLKKYKSAKFWGSLNFGEPQKALLVLAATTQRVEVRRALIGSYSIETYTLRPGYYLDLWSSNEALEKYLPPYTVPDLLVLCHPIGRLVPGLKREVFSGMEWKGEPVQVSHDTNGLGTFIDPDDAKLHEAPYSVRWSGFIKIQSDGIYRFSTDSDDGSKLLLDGLEVIDNGGPHTLKRQSRSVNLSAGLHKWELLYNDAGGYGELTVYWKRPGLLEAIIPGDVFNFNNSYEK